MNGLTWSDQIIYFMSGFRISGRLPSEVKILEPWQSDEALRVASIFYKKYYSDRHRRRLILGINPGRFGGGQTGIPFTDPVRLMTDCGIANPMNPRPELSAEFIYRMMNVYGGPEKFYSKFYISSVCPVGFIQNGKNLNYYDIPALQRQIEKWAPGWIETQINFGLKRDLCYCLGEGKNFDFFNKLNQKFNWFNEVIPLPHPRFIMQYRRKDIEAYIRRYVEVLKSD